MAALVSQQLKGTCGIGVEVWKAAAYCSGFEVREERVDVRDRWYGGGGKCKERFRTLYNGYWQSPNLGEWVTDVGG
jgi:hypothetical protein